MNSRELFEMASLDVLGLLDDKERAAFEEAYRAAPPHVQAQIRAEQLRSTRIEDTLPDVEAPAGLKSKVMAAVREAIASVRTEPIAYIGPGAARAGLSVSFWRAACIGCATASLVLGFFAWKVNTEIKAISSDALSGALINEMTYKAGADFSRMLARPTFRHVAFTPDAPDVAGRAEAALLLDPASGGAYLVCNGLPIASGRYILVADTPTGGERQVADFTASPGTFFIKIDGIDPQLLSGVRLKAPQPDGGKPQTILTARLL